LINLDERTGVENPRVGGWIPSSATIFQGFAAMRALFLFLLHGFCTGLLSEWAAERALRLQSRRIKYAPAREQ
jgi:hypothetical protein